MMNPVTELKPATIHPTAIISPSAKIGAGVSIGPFCTVGPDVELSDGVTLVSHVVVDGHTVIGEGATLWPFCSVGLAPQDLKYRGEPTRTEIGARTQIREHCTIHRGTVTGTGLTKVGSDCLLMAVAHVAHDCEVGNNVIIANNVVMGGHVTIGDHAGIMGAAAIHQFVRIGRCAWVGGVSGVERDVIPFGMVMGNRAWLAGLNIVGLKRRGYDRSEIHRLRAAFRILYRDTSVDDGVFQERVQRVAAEYGEDRLITEMLAFIAAPSHRGLIRNGVRDDGAEPA
ncbi:Acyl-[acyl-carrier-protein]--UDP-N-acetylglucosamine O-acyltransferase [Granulibacter bethesdensis]|uniref:Acyl-[acyl-carrier-protein]--UDP-N-acetylglucosamine O-acyltransferase n=2 Tax=Granulibacter bethesdensis TaxID=364410 RepID=A0AAN0RDF4_9PROT|nr:acyl-ACP--UDP-N-acetylglucosamine O-acyltransferase [Granulibacter bethesdensis]AHJ62774.1 Acyl-[acyl-carrier-protein]--UDP-N-acetylglucosamine O-acyltransferase [Granulibacter bethesdensis]AHJ66660.1 Acyl-[acyl-carrier-protein]--UDP-N-acetylglucosamine O-acyltransferase [Granulibacter bethesdensis CGDNIH4]APH59277.1 Acyl-[acyl-carrier-protein]--UDP-N-acetylglucosamine O-acyltransferase [Granulibacter bethesdensis]